MSDRVSCSIDDGVADVRLTRADKMNACDTAMFEALEATGLELAKDRSLRAAVLSGEGRCFSAGIDVSSFGGGPGGGRNLLGPRTEGGPGNFVQSSARVWTELPVPVVAAVHGVCFGAGLQIALGADIRFVAPDARLSLMEIKWGLIPDVTATQTLRRIVRLDVAKELAFTGRIVSGSEAVEIGLATHLSDTPHEAALELAREIAGRSPSAIRAGKQLFEEATLCSVEEGLALEASLQRSIIGKPNQIEAVKANLEKRAPRFHDPD